MLSHAVLGFIGGVFVVWVLKVLRRRRLARKRLVYAALAVINNYRRTINKPYPVEQFKDRCETVIVMNQLIDATQYVN